MCPEESVSDNRVALNVDIGRTEYCITKKFRVEEIFAIFANLDFARNFPPAKIISTANGISRNFPPAKFSSREIFLPRNCLPRENKIIIEVYKTSHVSIITNSRLSPIVGITGIRNLVKPSGLITFLGRLVWIC